MYIYFILHIIGRVLYQGPRSAMVSYFSQFNYICPNTYNPADFALFLSQRETEDQFYKSGLFDSNAKQAAMLTAEILTKAGTVHVNASKFPIKRQSTILQQLYHLTKREVFKVRRDKGALIAKFGITIFLNGLYGLIFMNVGAKGDGDPDHLNAHFGVIMMVSISSMFGSAQPIMLALPVERPMFLREYATGTCTYLYYYYY